jgi:hypothetical protein
VYTTLILHNWMVTERVHNDEQENGNFYDQAEEDDLLNQPADKDQELEGMEREDAEHEKLQRLVDAADGDVSPAITQQLNQRKAMYNTQMTKIVHYRWAGLYDGAEHIRLRDAIMNTVSGRYNEIVE